ncbi:YggN family protein [Photobacterium swingsii]|uniref:YggN family protein n=1 Tax=Photobacterium swingsii TaxID=680026 RepID=UPI00352DB3A3
MKKLVLAFTVLAASVSAATVQAKSCPVDVQHEVRIAGDQVSVYEAGQPKLLIDENNNVFVNGKQLDLNDMQQRALDAYSESVKENLPKMADLAKDGVGVANDVLDEVSADFDSKESFAKVQSLIDEYAAKANDKFYPEGEFVMPKDLFDEMDTSWKAEFEQALKHVSMESASAMFAALSAEMKDGDLSFSELQTKFSDLKARLEARIRSRSSEMAVKANDLCDSMKGLAQEEQEVQKVIPELKDYQVFES